MVLPLAPIEPPSFLPGGPWALAWHDEFDGPELNASWWNVGTLKAANGDLIPGAYGGHQLNWKHLDYVTADDVMLDAGTLRLRSQRRTVQGTDPVGQFNYTSGWVHSMHKVTFEYGYVEARIRFPLGAKVHPAFWAIEEDRVWGAEWDIAE